MVSSGHRILACILLCFGLTSFAEAQSGGSVSGKVTFKKKPAAGVIVAVISENDDGSRRSRHQGRTDEEGNYRVANLPAGNYYVYPIAPALVPDKGAARPLVLIGQGENIANLDFALVQGGVITGKITNAEGQPLIEEPVSIIPVNQEPSYSNPELDNFITDD